MFVLLKDSTPPHEIANVWYQVRKKVGDIRGQLPAGVQGPFFNDEFGDVYGVMFAFSTDGFSYRELKDYVEQARQDLLRVPNVAKVDLFGVQDEKIYIEISHRKLAQLGLDIGQLAQQLNAQNAVEGAGVVVLPTDNVQVRITGEFRAVEDLRQLPIRANGLTYKLGDVATITRGYVDPPRDKMRAGRRGDSRARGDRPRRDDGEGRRHHRARPALARPSSGSRRTLPVGIDMAKVADQPRAVSTSVNEFLRVLVEALVIVLAVSFVSLGLHTRPLRIDMRPGLVVLLTIPLVLAITFLGMWALNINLHKISLGALIIALGLLVDDAIIAVEMMVRKMEEGYDRTAAVTFMYESTAFPMLTGTLITAAGFLPIALARSSAGEYTFSIFGVTALALVISWFVAVLFVPLLGVWLLKAPPKAERRRAARAVHDPVLFALPAPGRLVRRVAQDRHRDHAREPGARRRRFPLRRAAVLPGLDPARAGGRPVAARGLEHRGDRDGDEEVRDSGCRSSRRSSTGSSYVGIGAPRFYLPLDQQFNNTNLAEVIVTPRSLAERDALRARMIELFRNDFPNLRGRVKLLPQGPPVPYPVQFRVQGTDVATVRSIADQVKDVVRANPNTVGVNDNWNEQVKSLQADARPGQGPRARRLEPGAGEGRADRPVGHHRRPVPRGQRADRHRAAAAATRSARRCRAWRTRTSRPHPAGPCRCRSS